VLCGRGDFLRQRPRKSQGTRAVGQRQDGCVCSMRVCGRQKKEDAASGWSFVVLFSLRDAVAFYPSNEEGDGGL